MKRILLLSAYDSASHRYWREGLCSALPEYEWVVKCQPARHFSWRVRTSGWHWALGDDPDFEQAFDLIIATSLSGVAPLMALRPALQTVPLWVYFHENQFAHPLAQGGARDSAANAAIRAGWCFQSLQNAWCARFVSFNSNYNRDTFLAGARQLLRRAPEQLPGDPLSRIEANSDVLPAPLRAEFLAYRIQKKEPGLIVWNHRWEWDKQPERFLRALASLNEKNIPFRLAMMGSGGGKRDELKCWRELLGERVVHWGEATPETYRHWVSRADFGVSTSLHDFQGLAMLELAQAGATVILPRRLAYPEVLSDAVFYDGSESDAGLDSAQLTETLARLLRERALGCSARHVSQSPLGWGDLADAYRRRVQEFIGV